MVRFQRLVQPAAFAICCVPIIAAHIAGCTSPTIAPTPLVVAPTAAPSPPPEPAPAPPPVAAAPPPVIALPEPPSQPKEPPPVELPDYAKRGKRLAAHGGAAGRAVLDYCKSFEIERDAQSYFRRLQRTRRLPTNDEVAERSRVVGQPQTVQQVVERDWALRRDSNRTAPQRCKVLGGSVDGATALIVFEADLNGRRQRGIATVLLADKKWRVRDHGDWVPTGK